jgi:glycosyltransferase involved in cell wall biosynthesis
VNVLVLAHSYPRFATDPVGSFILRLAVAVRPAGVDVRVIAPGGEGLAAREAYEGIVVERFRYAPRKYETLAYTGTMRSQVLGSWPARASMGSFVAAETAKALRVGRAFRPDLVHAHWWFPAGLVGGWLRRWWRAPLVVTLHGSDLRLAQDLPVATRLFRRVLRGATTVTTVSSWLARETEALVPGVRPVVAPMPVVPDLFGPGSARARDRLLFVGKLNPQKGIIHALRALALMHAKPTLDVVVGVGGAPEDLEPLVRELNLEGRIRWHPLLGQAELARLYRSATALVAPWVDEGLGLVAIEAQLSEMPVVAFRSGGLTDIVAHEHTGLLVPAGDAPALAAALDRLLALPDQGAAWGRAGRQAALATFSPETAARRYADVYRDALDRRRT